MDNRKYREITKLQPFNFLPKYCEFSPPTYRVRLEYRNMISSKAIECVLSCHRLNYLSTKF